MVVLTSFPPPEEGIQHQQAQTEAHVGSSVYGVGTLYIAQSRVSWRGESGFGFSLEYPAISLHAVSRDVSNFPKECLYLMVDGIIDDRPADQQPDGEEEEDSAAYTEVRFAPAQTNTLEAMYAAMCECQALHPDDQESMSDDEEGGDGDCFEDAEGEVELTPQGQATLRHLENIFIGDGPRPTNGSTNQEGMDADESEQFADAEN